MPFSTLENRQISASPAGQVYSFSGKWIFAGIATLQGPVVRMTVSVRPTHLPDTAAEGHGPSSGFSMPPQRRTYSKSFKAQVIQECSEPGASIANIALGYSLNANLVHKWIRLHTQKTTAIQPAFIPLPSQMLGAGSHAQVRCCDHEFDPVGP